MWFLIVTGRSLLWMLTSLLATLMMLSALVSPSWLISEPQNIQYGNETVRYTPSIGVNSKCSKPIRIDSPICTSIAVMGLATDSEVYPAAWKSATVFLAIGLTIMSVTVCASLVSCCFQSIFRKSIFSVAGAAQAAAGLCFIVGAMHHPFSWGATRVVRLCGRDAQPFYPGDCKLGPGIWLVVVGTVLTFVAACLSVPADKSTSSDKVQDEIYDGHTLICLT